MTFPSDSANLMDRQTREACMNMESFLVFVDAMDHRLYEEYSGLTRLEVMARLADRIGLQVQELRETSSDPEHYTEELADIIIMAFSAAGYLGIDIGKAVEHKRIINCGRANYHAD